MLHCKRFDDLDNRDCDDLTIAKPVIPLAAHKYKEVACPICHFMQDLKYTILFPQLKEQMT